MAYSIKEGKDLVIKAGKILVQSGLIARTWGNISARISDTQFVITPSGLAYENLTPDEIVVVNIEDCSYEGNIKPSSEKGIHADGYRLRKDVNFIIHTHQVMASAISIDGKSIEVYDEEFKKVLGEKVPCASYGMPSTKKLRKAVEKVISENKNSKAVLMKYHGTVCYGKDLEDGFNIAETLEKLSEDKFNKIFSEKEETISLLKDYGKSYRKGVKFVLNYEGKTEEYTVGEVKEEAPKVVKLHEAIYKHSKVNNIIHGKEEAILKVCREGHVLKPYLDDLAQIAGVNIKCLKDSEDNIKNIAKELKNKNAILIEGIGALCTGITESEAEAVDMVLNKGCIADIYGSKLNLSPLGSLDANIQRIIYVKKYSKQKDKEV